MNTILCGGTPARRAVLCLSAALLFAACLVPVVTARPVNLPLPREAAIVSGTWTGRSTCVGNNPACKNEDVVYRFLSIDGAPDSVMMLGDKIIAGKRVPMGALKFAWRGADRLLTCDFTIGQTRRLWSFTVSGDRLTGTLVTLPDKSVTRRVNAHRVRDDQVPKAPALDEYE